MAKKRVVAKTNLKIRMKIKKLPNILALHLKRFKYQEQLQKYIKLTYRVVFPFELRLFNTVCTNINAGIEDKNIHTFINKASKIIILCN